MTEHTPGPWDVFDRFGNNSVLVGVSEHVCGEYDGAVCQFYSGYGYKSPTYDNFEANARLVAAAPLMYELLKNPCPNIERGDSGWCSCDICGTRAQLLAKIEGESNE